MLYNTVELCLFCDARLTHNAIFNYYLLPLKKKKYYYVIMSAVGNLRALYIDGGSKFKVLLFI